MASKKKEVAEVREVSLMDTRVNGIGNNQWVSKVGEPNGGFRIPGSDKVFSLRGLIQFLEKNIPTIYTVDPSNKITNEGTLDFDSALNLMGETPKKVETKKLKVKATVKDAEAILLYYLKDHPSGRTKVQIKKDLNLTEYAVDKLLSTLKTKFKKDAGKDGAFKVS